MRHHAITFRASERPSRHRGNVPLEHTESEDASEPLRQTPPKIDNGDQFLAAKKVGRLERLKCFVRRSHKNAFGILEAGCKRIRYQRMHAQRGLCFSRRERIVPITRNPLLASERHRYIPADSSMTWDNGL